jgi:hypothetical protein
MQIVDQEDLLSRFQELLNGIFRKESDKVLGTWTKVLMIVSQMPPASREE